MLIFAILVRMQHFIIVNACVFWLPFFFLKFLCFCDISEQITAEGEPDEAVERVGADAVKLYRVSDESGDMSTEEISPLNGGGFTAELLEVGLGLILVWS